MAKLCLRRALVALPMPLSNYSHCHASQQYLFFFLFVFFLCVCHLKHIYALIHSLPSNVLTVMCTLTCVLCHAGCGCPEKIHLLGWGGRDCGLFIRLCHIVSWPLPGLLPQ